MTSLQTNFSRDLPGLPADRRDQIVRRIARDEHVRRSTAERWFEETLKFLDACANEGAPVSPPRRVDRAWHVFILFTRDYRSYCTARHGVLIHHDPMEKPNSEAYERAYLWVEEHYGALPRRIWPPPASRCSGGWGFGGGCVAGGCGGGGCGGGG